jgi:hypothetical protein
MCIGHCTWLRIVLNMLNELKDDMDKIQKMVYEQNVSINKEIENPTKNTKKTWY